MRRRLLALGLLASGTAISVLTAIGGCAKDATPASSPDPIVIGVSLGLTKGLAATCAPIRNAVRVAEGELNAGGGVLGRPVKFDIVDDKSDEANGVRRIATDFTKKGVAAMLGPAGSEQVKQTQDIFAKASILQLVPAATSTDLTTIQPADNHRFLFRTTPADDFQAAAVMLLATRTPSALGDGGVAPAVDAGPLPPTCNKMATVYIDNSYGQAMTKVIADNFPKRGAGHTVVGQTKIPVDAKASYTTEAAAVIASAPECLAVIAYEKTGAQFIRDLKAQPTYAALQAKGFFIIGTDGLFTDGFLDFARSDPSDETSASVAEGVYGTNPDTQPGTSEYNAFRALYSSYFPLEAGEAPPFAANAFDAAVLIAFAIQKAGSATNRSAIRDALQEVASPPGTPISPSEIKAGLRQLRDDDGDIDYKGASGNLDFEATGNVTAGFIVWQAQRDASKKMVLKTISRFDESSLLEQVQ